MKDEHDKVTLELVPSVQAVAEADPQGQTRTPARGIKPRKPFNVFRLVDDYPSMFAPKPKGAKLASVFGCAGGYFVPVSFVAKDWNVTTRRIRALLAGGRLAGRLLDNGYWEVRFPYQFTLGTRGPGLKRQQRQPGKPKNPESIQERQP